MIQHLAEHLPVETPALTPPIQPFEYDSTYFPVVSVQHLCIAADTIIVPVSLQLLPQRVEDGRRACFASLPFDPGKNRRQCRTKLLLRRVHCHQWFP